jgi:hypothetical protein
MAYFRGDTYIFDTGDHCHFWWDGEYVGNDDTDRRSGVMIATDIVDRFVLQRLAELLVDKRAVAMLDQHLAAVGGGGNCGDIQLLGNAAVLRSALQDLEGRCRPYTPEDVWASCRRSPPGSEPTQG